MHVGLPRQIRYIPHVPQKCSDFKYAHGLFIRNDFLDYATLFRSHVLSERDSEKERERERDKEREIKRERDKERDKEIKRERESAGEATKQTAFNTSKANA